MDIEKLSNLEAEQQLLGAMITNHSAISAVKDMLKPEHFVGQNHPEIYQTIIEMYHEGIAVTPSLLASKLTGTFTHYTAQEYLVTIMGMSIVVIAPVSYAEVIADLHTKRCIVDSCAEIMNEISASPMETGAEVALRCAGKMRDLILTSTRNQFLTDRSIAESLIAGIHDDARCYKTGLDSLDYAMDGGLYAGRVYGFFARMKMGKTILAGTIAHNLMRQGHKTLFIAGEMSAGQIHERILARMMGCFSSDFRKKEQRESRFFQQKLSQATSELNGALVYSDAAGLSFQKLKDIVSTAREKHDVQVIILDYWQLVTSTDSRIGKAEHLSRVAQWIAESAKDTGIAWVVIGQLNREGKVKDSDGAGAAFDQIYHIMGNPENREDSSRWIKMEETRYTAWNDCGSEDDPAFKINPKGLFFDECA